MHFVCAVALVSIEVDYCTFIDMNLSCIGWMVHFGFVLFYWFISSYYLVIYEHRMAVSIPSPQTNARE